MEYQYRNAKVLAVQLPAEEDYNLDGFRAFVDATQFRFTSERRAMLDFFPDQGFHPVEIAEHNRQARFEFERIRDFVILHYKLNQRDDSEFWKACADMSIPDSLAHKIELYRARGRVLRVDQELFAEPAWLQVMEGQNLVPERYHPLVDLQSEADIHGYLESVRQVIEKCVGVMPDHAQFIREHCQAAAVAM